MIDTPKTLLSRRLTLFAVLAGLGACSNLPERPVRPALFDFGPGLASETLPVDRGQPLPIIVVAEIDPGGFYDSSNALMYRLGYAEDLQLRTYSQARWSQPPAQLLGQRLRERLAGHYSVFSASQGAALVREASQAFLQLRLGLEEFSQLFDSPTHSVGLVRLRATLVKITPRGEVFLGQRVLIGRSPAPSADAQGGVSALASASDLLASDLLNWLAVVREQS
jgi:cholesterol transport system auxiliary component